MTLTKTSPGDTTMTNATETFQYAMHSGWSDTDPYEVVRYISDKCIEVREMKAEMAADYKPNFAPGGFSGHCTNQGSQKWVITSDESGAVERIRLHKDGRWYGVGKRRFVLANEPRKYYDFNF
jgi:hypothetical protein